MSAVLGSSASPIIWPEPASVAVKSGRYGARSYLTPDGEYPSVTTALKVLGLSTNALVAWAAREERKAILEACADVYAEGVDGGPSEFAAAVEAKIGQAKAHQRLLTQAGDIGTAAHARVQWQMANEIGQPAGPEPVVPEQSLFAWMAYDSWWKESGLRAVRTEQPVWDRMGYAGTIDLVAEDVRGDYGGGLGIVDVKTSKGLYETHHVQVAAYMHAGRNFADLKWACLVKIPKDLEKPEFEVHPMGEMYGGKKLGEDALFDVFAASLRIWQVLCA